MQKCPFKIGDQIYNIIENKKYTVCTINRNVGLVYEIIVLSNKQTQWYTPIMNDEWVNYILLKDYRKLKLQKLNENRNRAI